MKTIPILSLLGLLAVMGSPVMGQIEKPRVATAMPAFSFKDINGRAVNSTNFTGKTLVIWFFASTDEPSRRELPVVQELQRDYRKSGLTVVGMALDYSNPEHLKNFAETNHVFFPIVPGDMEFMQGTGGLRSVPTILVVEPHGNILNRHEGFTDRPELESDLKRIEKMTQAAEPAKPHE